MKLKVVFLLIGLASGTWWVHDRDSSEPSAFMYSENVRLEGPRHLIPRMIERLDELGSSPEGRGIFKAIRGSSHVLVLEHRSGDDFSSRVPKLSENLTNGRGTSTKLRIDFDVLEPQGSRETLRSGLAHAGSLLRGKLRYERPRALILGAR